MEEIFEKRYAACRWAVAKSRQDVTPVAERLWGGVHFAIEDFVLAVCEVVTNAVKAREHSGGVILRVAADQTTKKAKVTVATDPPASGEEYARIAGAWWDGATLPLKNRLAQEGSRGCGIAFRYAERVEVSPDKGISLFFSAESLKREVEMRYLLVACPNGLLPPD